MHWLKEENENEDIQPDCFLCIRQEWSRRNFKRNRSRTGNREERSDRQVQKRAEQHTVHRMDTRSQLLKTCARKQIASTAAKGRPTPVIRKPIVAQGVFQPAFWPKNTGKIRFPAPKNSAKSMSPIEINSREDSCDDFFISDTPSLLQSETYFMLFYHRLKKCRSKKRIKH